MAFIKLNKYVTRTETQASTVTIFWLHFLTKTFTLALHRKGTNADLQSNKLTYSSPTYGNYIIGLNKTTVTVDLPFFLLRNSWWTTNWNNNTSTEPPWKGGTNKAKIKQGNKLESWNEAINTVKKSRLNPSVCSCMETVRNLRSSWVILRLWEQNVCCCRLHCSRAEMNSFMS